MAHFYIMDGGYLVSQGFAADGLEHLQASEGQRVMMGEVPGFTDQTVPHSGAKWHVGKAGWVDGRSDAERQAQVAVDVVVARRADYPALEKFADAFYWQQRGKPEKMAEWLAACDAVKQRYQKG